MEENLTENIEQPTQEVQAAEPTPQQHADNDASINMANLRAAKEKAERERAEMAAQIEEMRKAQQQPAEEEPDYSDSDFVEGKHLKKEISAINKQLEAYKHQQMEAVDESRLKQAYSDFDKVVTPENLEKLKKMDPETAETIATSQASLYTRGSAAYKRIKELNFIVEDKHAGDREKAQENIAKPRPANSVSPQHGEGPLSMANAFANGLTEEVKKQLWREMNEASKKY
jgi:hypothetical protein